MSDQNEGRLSPENAPENQTAENTPTPRLQRALEHRERVTFGVQPVYVDTSNSNSVNPANISLPKADRKKPLIKVNHRTVSLDLRARAGAICQLSEQNPGGKLWAITVKFSPLFSKKIAEGKKRPQDAYQQLLNERIRYRYRKLGIPSDTNRLELYLFVLEQSPRTPKFTLHAHFFAYLMPEDRLIFEQIIKQDAGRENNSVRFQDTYVLQHSAEPKSIEYQMLRAEIEEGLLLVDDDGNDVEDDTPDCFPQWEVASNGRLVKRGMPVDLGWVDYLAKDLDESITGVSKGKNYSSPQVVQKKAKDLYLENYRAQQESKRQLECRKKAIEEAQKAEEEPG